MEGRAEGSRILIVSRKRLSPNERAALTISASAWIMPDRELNIIGQTQAQAMMVIFVSSPAPIKTMMM
ncbi:hypothetical protein D3C73_1653780 [compost metagenome]